jgi:hypothetical protein
MRQRVVWIEVCLVATLAVAFTGCVSQRPPRGDARPTQIEGKVQSLKGSLLVVAGDDGTTNVTIGKATSIIKAEVGELSNIAEGKWLEVQGKKAKDSSSIQADLIRISDRQPSDKQAKSAGPGGQGGPGGGPDGGAAGGPGGGPGDAPPSEEAPGYRGIVKSIDGNTIVIAMSRGGRTTQVTLIVDSYTTIMKLTKATADALSPGAQVTVSGDEGQGSKVLARSIEIKQ